MESNVVKFNKSDHPEFYKVLRKRVNNHFSDNNISKHANVHMIVKTTFMVLLYFTPLFMLIFGAFQGTGMNILMWVIMGFGMSGIGLSIMHDANHGSYSKNSKVNFALGFLINFVGGYHVNWKIQHNVLHHSFTNIHGHDEDIEKGIIRFSPDQERKPYFKYQVFYAPFLYGIMTLYWLLGKDIQQVLRYNEKNLLEGQGVSFKKAMIEITYTKIGYIILTFILPMTLSSLAWWQTLLGFLMMHFISGLILALIFQPAHVVEETNFYKPDENGSVENNWAIHQLRTTANFANKSIFFSWFIGGLNFQIEHHLFPNICHVHYKKISKIVKKTAEEFNIPYYQHRTFLGALKSHFTLLHELGTGKYDQKVAMGTT